jgi:1-acyl-sn-glycerol-3-phosphate acyltransferase
MIRSVFLFVYLGLALVFVLPWFIVWSLLTGKPDAMYDMAMRAVRLGVKLAGVRVRIEGAENIPAGVCVFAANHISAIDPLAFIPAIPRRVAILVKKELFRIPFLGPAMQMADFVGVDRADREAAAASVDVVVERLKKGTSFVVYPEGTRSPDGRLRSFKRGTSLMAIEAGVPVVPVSIAGAQKVLPKGEWKIRGGEIVIRFGPAVDGRSYTVEQRAELLERVQALVAAGLPPDQQPAE